MLMHLYVLTRFGANSANVEVFFCSECMHPWLNGIGVYNMEAYNKNQVTQ